MFAQLIADDDRTLNKSTPPGFLSRMFQKLQASLANSGQAETDDTIGYVVLCFYHADFKLPFTLAGIMPGAADFNVDNQFIVTLSYVVIAGAVSPLVLRWCSALACTTVTCDGGMKLIS